MYEARPRTPAEALALGREPTPLVVCQTEAAALHLFLQYSVLLDQVLDDLLLVPVDPAGDGEQE